MTLIMRLVRAEMLEVLRTDYIKFARARGLSDRAVHFGHALKNTLVPVITIAGLQLGSLIAFALITETCSSGRAWALLFLGAVQNVDIPIMAAYLMLVAFIFVMVNLVVDILYCRGGSAPARPPRNGLRRAPWLHDADRRCRTQTRKAAFDLGEVPRFRHPGELRRFEGYDVSGLVTVVMLVGALLAPWIAPTNPFDPASVDLMNSLFPPRWIEGGDPQFLLGTDNQGRDLLSAILYGMRVSLHRGHLRRSRSQPRSASPWGCWQAMSAAGSTRSSCAWRTSSSHFRPSSSRS